MWVLKKVKRQIDKSGEKIQHSLIKECWWNTADFEGYWRLKNVSFYVFQGAILFSSGYCCRKDWSLFWGGMGQFLCGSWFVWMETQTKPASFSLFRIRGFELLLFHWKTSRYVEKSRKVFLSIRIPSVWTADG